MLTNFPIGDACVEIALQRYPQEVGIQVRQRQGEDVDIVIAKSKRPYIRTPRCCSDCSMCAKASRTSVSFWEVSSHHLRSCCKTCFT